MGAKISKHISLKEATRSNTAQRLGINNYFIEITLCDINERI